MPPLRVDQATQRETELDCALVRRKSFCRLKKEAICIVDIEIGSTKPVKTIISYISQ